MKFHIGGGTTIRITSSVGSSQDKSYEVIADKDTGGREIWNAPGGASLIVDPISQGRNIEIRGLDWKGENQKTINESVDGSPPQFVIRYEDLILNVVLA